MGGRGEGEREKEIINLWVEKGGEREDFAKGDWRREEGRNGGLKREKIREGRKERKYGERKILRNRERKD